MEIKVNGETAVVLAGTTLAEWLKNQETDLATVIVEHNGQILTGEKWDKIILQDSDILEVFSFVGGG